MTGPHRFNRSSITARLSLLGLLLSSIGCAGMVGPNWRNPGTMQDQQRRAMLDDPYPDTDAGPEMLGVRPRDFQQSLPEAEKLRPNFYASPPRRVGW